MPGSEQVREPRKVNRSRRSFPRHAARACALGADENRVVDPVLVEAARLGELLAQARLGPQASNPTVLAHERTGRAADLGNQGLMLIDALRHQRRQCLRRALDAIRRRVLPIAKQPGRYTRQRRQVIDRIPTVVHRVAQDGAEFTRKCVRDHPFALDQAAVAVARFLARSAAIDEDHIAASLLQMKRDTHSHHSRAEDDDIGPDRHVDRSPSSIVHPWNEPIAQSLTIGAEYRRGVWSIASHKLLRSKDAPRQHAKRTSRRPSRSCGGWDEVRDGDSRQLPDWYNSVGSDTIPSSRGWKWTGLAGLDGTAFADHTPDAALFREVSHKRPSPSRRVLSSTSSV